MKLYVKTITGNDLLGHRVTGHTKAGAHVSVNVESDTARSIKKLLAHGGPLTYVTFKPREASSISVA